MRRLFHTMPDNTDDEAEIVVNYDERFVVDSTSASNPFDDDYFAVPDRKLVKDFF